MAHGLGVAALANPHQVTLPLQHAPGSDDEAGALNLPGEIEEDWSQRMAAALEVARLGCKICPSDLWGLGIVLSGSTVGSQSFTKLTHRYLKSFGMPGVLQRQNFKFGWDGGTSMKWKVF